MSARRENVSRSGPKRVRGMVKLIGWLAVLLGALSLVIWRQPRGIEMEAALRTLEMERAIAETERIEALRRIEELRSRARIVQVASTRLGMHIPDDSEIVFLPRVDMTPAGDTADAGSALPGRVASAGGRR